MVSVIEMAHLYSARHSFVLLRPNNKVDLLTLRTQHWMCMGKWAFEIWAELFLKNEKIPDDRSFLPQWVRYHSPGIKRFHQESTSRDEETIHVLSRNFSIFAKTTIHKSAENTDFGQVNLLLLCQIGSVDDKR